MSASSTTSAASSAATRPPITSSTITVAAPQQPTEFQLHQPPTDGITQVIFGHQSDVLLASSWDKSVRFYDCIHNNLRLEIAHPESVLDVCFSEDDKTAYSVGLETAVSSTDLTTGVRSTLQSGETGHTGTIRCVVWHGGTQMLFTGGWDCKLIGWDARTGKMTQATTPEAGCKIYTIGLSGNRLIVGTADRHVLIYDVRNLNAPEQKRESSLMNQTRCIRGFPDTTGYTLSSIEGRVAVEYFNPDVNVQKNKYAFKCHRKTEGGTQVLYPVNAMAFHPKYGTFATGGCDGIVNVWDGANKKRICQYPVYPTSIAALNFNAQGDKLAVAASYTYEEGEKDHPADAIYIRTVHQHEVLPKVRTGATAGK